MIVVRIDDQELAVTNDAVRQATPYHHAGNWRCPEVIFANQQKSGNAPQGQYASSTRAKPYVSAGSQAAFKRNTPNDKIETKVRAQIIATCSVNFFRGDAHMFAERLFECNKHPNISMMLMKAGLGWNGADAVNDLTALQSANWEQRAQVSIRVMYVTETQSEINNILSASAVMQDAKGRVLSSIDVQHSRFPDSANNRPWLC